MGAEVVKHLQDTGIPFRAADAGRQRGCGSGLAIGVEAVTFDFSKNETYFPSTFAGVEKMFLMRPPHISDIDRSINRRVSGVRGQSGRSFSCP